MSNTDEEWNLRLEQIGKDYHFTPSQKYADSILIVLSDLQSHYLQPMSIEEKKKPPKPILKKNVRFTNSTKFDDA
mgnify:CR=1 FL=1